MEETLLRGFLGETEWPVMAEDRDRVVMTGSEPRRSAKMSDQSDCLFAGCTLQHS